MTITVFPPTITATGYSSLLTTGEEIFSREYGLGVLNLTASTQTLKLSYFTARKTEVTTQVRVGTGTTAAAATPTICRIGLYLIDSGNGGTLVASTTNDTTLFAAAQTVYTKSWTSSYTKIAGQRYALGHLVVSGVATPTWSGQAFSASVPSRAEWATDQRLAAILSSQSDLPSTFTNASLSSTIDGRTYAAILP